MILRLHKISLIKRIIKTLLPRSFNAACINTIILFSISLYLGREMALIFISIAVLNMAVAFLILLFK
jgi:hypothetical protein